MSREMTKNIVFFIGGVLVGVLGLRLLVPPGPNPRFTPIEKGAMFDQLTGRMCVSIGSGSPSLPACSDLLRKR
jgi:hypothetical protein